MRASPSVIVVAGPLQETVSVFLLVKFLLEINDWIENLKLCEKGIVVRLSCLGCAPIAWNDFVTARTEEVKRSQSKLIHSAHISSSINKS